MYKARSCRWGLPPGDEVDMNRNGGTRDSSCGRNGNNDANGDSVSVGTSCRRSQSGGDSGRDLNGDSAGESTRLLQ